MQSAISTSSSNVADVNLPCLATGSLAFPPVETALEEPNGLLAWGGDLSPARLLAAYRHGVFPWYSEPDPILWWSPDPRAVILPETLHIPRRLRRRLRTLHFRVTTDQAFERVIRHCADGSSLHRERGTWITPAMQAAYLELYRLGHAHSVEVWLGDRLAGGLYGIALGRVFHGESMFSHEPDASSVALVTLAGCLFAHDFVMIDTQVLNPHTGRFGAVACAREAFLALMQHAHRVPATGPCWGTGITHWASA